MLSDVAQVISNPGALISPAFLPVAMISTTVLGGIYIFTRVADWRESWQQLFHTITRSKPEWERFLEGKEKGVGQRRSYATKYSRDEHGNYREELHISDKLKSLGLEYNPDTEGDADADEKLDALVKTLITDIKVQIKNGLKEDKVEDFLYKWRRKNAIWTTGDDESKYAEGWEGFVEMIQKDIRSKQRGVIEDFVNMLGTVGGLYSLFQLMAFDLTPYLPEFMTSTFLNLFDIVPLSIWGLASGTIKNLLIGKFMMLFTEKDYSIKGLSEHIGNWGNMKTSEKVEFMAFTGINIALTFIATPSNLAFLVPILAPLAPYVFLASVAPMVLFSLGGKIKKDASSIAADIPGLIIKIGIPVLLGLIGLSFGIELCAVLTVIGIVAGLALSKVYEDSVRDDLERFIDKNLGNIMMFVGVTVGIAVGITEVAGLLPFAIPIPAIIAGAIALSLIGALITFNSHNTERGILAAINVDFLKDFASDKANVSSKIQIRGAGTWKGVLMTGVVAGLCLLGAGFAFLGVMSALALSSEIFFLLSAGVAISSVLTVGSFAFKADSKITIVCGLIGLACGAAAIALGVEIVPILGVLLGFGIATAIMSWGVVGAGMEFEKLTVTELEQQFNEFKEESGFTPENVGKYIAEINKIRDSEGGITNEAKDKAIIKAILTPKEDSALNKLLSQEKFYKDRQEIREQLVDYYRPKLDTILADNSYVARTTDDKISLRNDVIFDHAFNATIKREICSKVTQFEEAMRDINPPAVLETGELRTV